jgi:large subunit ribosomal protein L6
MSHIGKKIITIPNTVSVLFLNQILYVTGPYGKLDLKIPSSLNIILNNNLLTVIQTTSKKDTKKYFGLFRTLINNMIQGVSAQFTKILILEGLGFKFQIENKNLILNIGFSHLIKINIPEDINISLESSNKIKIIGISKEKVGLFASIIRNYKIPEPYKGKGILYENEIIIKKVGKKAK